MDEIQPFPLLAIVGQAELKMALILSLINPNIGGVLLSGPYGVGKTTAVRGLLDIMPTITVDEPDDHGETRNIERPMRLVELPLNARMEDVVGSINERVALEQNRLLLEEGILAKAHNNLLYVDEVNLLDAHLIDAILDAAAQGRTMVRRGPFIRLFPTRFVLIGSMNPEEGTLRPQIMDRFGLRVWVAPLAEARQRLDIYHRAQRFREDPSAFRTAYADQTAELREEVLVAREILPYVVIPPHIETLALAIIQELKIPSHRAEIALLEAARARAAADFRSEVIVEDIERMAVLSLRQRRSPALESYAVQVQQENEAVDDVLKRLIAAPPTPHKSDQRAEEAPHDPAVPANGDRKQHKGRRSSKVRELEQSDHLEE